MSVPSPGTTYAGSGSGGDIYYHNNYNEPEIYIGGGGGGNQQPQPQPDPFQLPDRRKVKSVDATPSIEDFIDLSLMPEDEQENVISQSGGAGNNLFVYLLIAGVIGIGAYWFWRKQHHAAA